VESHTGTAAVFLEDNTKSIHKDIARQSRITREKAQGMRDEGQIKVPPFSHKPRQQYQETDSSTTEGLGGGGRMEAHQKVVSNVKERGEIRKPHAT